MKLKTKKILGLVSAFTLVLGMTIPAPVIADLTNPDAPASQLTERISGYTLYDTAAEVALKGWTSAPAVVLATGERFPDALSGTVLAHKELGPLLLTESKNLSEPVKTQLQRLSPEKVYILGGTGAVSKTVEDQLVDAGYKPERIFGYDQYETAAEIAKKVTNSSTKAFLVTGERFPDALSISSYAANQGIPILMTRPDRVPDSTLKALDALGVQEVTIIGGTGIIKQSVESQLASLPRPIRVADRLAGNDQYDTNLKILNTLTYDQSNIYAATGANFPDALAGAALAAQNNNPILLVSPPTLKSATTDYANSQRQAGAKFWLLGGTGVISYGIESIIRTGSLHPRMSLQYLHGGIAGPLGMLKQLEAIPSPATDYADVASPSWFTLVNQDGSITGWESDPSSYGQFVSAAHARNLKVLPTVNSSWQSSDIVDTALASPEARTNLVNQISARIDALKLDGIVIDFELMKTETGPGLTAFMQELYAKLHPQNKLVVMAVMSKTGNENWYDELDYRALSQTVDFLNIMTYDFSTSLAGPIAPLDWVESVLAYAKSQGVDMSKVLMGIPYYGKDWWQDSTGKNNVQGRGLYNLIGSKPEWSIDGVTERFTQYQATSETGLQRDASLIPHFSYTNEQGQHTVYYDDGQSWNTKLSLLSKYGLGGIGAWSLYWTNNPDTVKVVFPLLKQYLR